MEQFFSNISPIEDYTTERDFIADCHGVPPALVAANANRMLRSKSRVTVHCSNTSTDLGGIIKAIGSESIAKLEVFKETGVNTAISHTYSVKLVLTEGALIVQGQWTGYRPEKLSDVVAYVLRPIYNSGLDARTKLVDGNNKRMPLSNSIGEALKQFASVSGVALEDELLRRLLK